MEKRTKDILSCAKRVLDEEAQAILNLKSTLDESFVKAVETILRCKGRLIIIAIGKSGHIGRKIAATMASTGTPSFYIHPSEALHGDLGMITRKDVVIAISNSGESEELNVLLPILQKDRVPIIGMTGNCQSTLAQMSKVVLSVKVDKEADPNNLAPTSSTTATLAMGDALAVALLEQRRFTVKDFALLHPGGNIGRSLLKVSGVMHSGKANPVIMQNKTVREALIVITAKGLGVVTIINEKGNLSGILTDGDIRRLLLSHKEMKELFNKKVGEVMTPSPITVNSQTLCVDAVRLMEDNTKKRFITVVPVVDEENHPVGMVHIHDLIRRGFSFQKDRN